MHPIIYKAARVSALAYCDSAQEFIDAGFTDVCHIIDEETSTEAFVLEDTNYIYVTFPGTETDEGLADIKTDLRFANRAHFHEMKLHRGFWEAWRGISDQVAEEVLFRVLRVDDEGNTLPTKPIIYCGHSLGGALATIGAATHNPQYCVTFGQPPVGGKKFVEKLEGMEVNYTRVVNNGDPVPHLLFWNPHYRHCGNVVFFDRAATVHLDPTLLKRIGIRGIPQFSFSDHEMSAYKVLCYANTRGDL